MMKKLLLASTVLAGMTAVASAADLPRRAAPPPVFAPVPVFTWTGFYAGFNAGYAFDTGENRNGFLQTPGNPVTLTGPGGAAVATSILPAGATLAYRSAERDGFTGGGQIGYNYQFTPGSGVVVGVEADAQYLDFGARRNNRFNVGPAGAINFINPNFVPVNGTLSTIDFFGTVRGRLGYAWDRTLIYGTGGFAYGSGSDERRFGGFRGNDDFRTGWTVGGGIEYALPTDSFLNFFRSSAVTLKVEGLYVNLDRGNRTQGAFVINNATNTVVATNPIGRRNDEFAVVRAGLNYKFGSY